jgi:glutaredoxin
VADNFPEAGFWILLSVPAYEGTAWVCPNRKGALGSYALSISRRAGKLTFAKVESRQVEQPRQVIVYSRKGCHLCEIVKETLVKLERRGGFIWRDIDVDSDEGLRRKFTDEVPVVFIDGRKAFKYRMDERDFLRRLAS